MFDPRVQFASAEEQESAKVSWNSTNVQWALDAIANGLPLKKGASPFFNNNIELRKADLNWGWMGDEVEEFLRCKEDIIYFANKYCKLVDDTGMTNNITLRKYQKRLLRAMQTKKYVIILSGRQIGKTTTTAIFLLWKLIFHRQESIALLGDKAATAGENLNKMKSILINLPFFLKPGIVVWNGGSVLLDNGSKVFTGPCKKSALVGKTLTCLYIDELDIPLANQSQELVEYALPTIAAVKTGQAIFSSTPSVGGIFKTLFYGAMEGRNKFFPIKVNWWEVPGRDLAWKQEMLGTYGKDAFNTQFNCKFLSSTQTIFNEDFISQLERDQSVYVPYERLFDDAEQFHVLPFAFDILNATGRKMLDQVEPIKNFKVRKDITIDWKKDFFIVTCDIAEGIGADDTVFNFFKLMARPKVEKIEAAPKKQSVDDYYNNLLNPSDSLDYMVDGDDDFQMGDDLFEDYDIYWGQVAIMIGNNATPKATAYWLRSFCTKMMSEDRYRISVEYNKYGEAFLNYLRTESVGRIVPIEVENFARTQVGDKSKAGVHLSSATKAMYVPNAKSDLESGRIVVNELITIDQLKYFGKIKNSYGAADGFKDDTVMTLVNLCAYIDKANDNYVSFIEDAMEALFELGGKEVDDFYGDGFDEWVG
ncbi:terminase family protein [Chryseobacterium phage MA9V-1]|nr:terminase family protein [Chryseobacterium phage MA9V-1]